LLVYRIASGLTQAELAEAAGVAPETISNAERGRHRPRGLTARAVASALGCEVEELFPPIHDERPPAAGAVTSSAGTGGGDEPD
jgi:DNA-binding XRE family transcriptional regulator